MFPCLKKALKTGRNCEKGVDTVFVVYYNISVRHSV